MYVGEVQLCGTLPGGSHRVSRSTTFDTYPDTGDPLVLRAEYQEGVTLAELPSGLACAIAGGPEGISDFRVMGDQRDSQRQVQGSSAGRSGSRIPGTPAQARCSCPNE
jgi:hypothetical protein